MCLLRGQVEAERFVEGEPMRVLLCRMLHFCRPRLMVPRDRAAFVWGTLSRNVSG